MGRFKKSGKLSYYDVFGNEDVYNFYYNNWVAFIEDFIIGTQCKKYGGDIQLDKNQLKIIEAVMENKRVTIRSPMGAGKTSTCAFLVLLWLPLHPIDTKVIVTAPSEAQLKSALWAEVRKWHSVSLIKDLYNCGKEILELVGYESQCFAVPRTVSTIESLQGAHAKNLLIIVDEASGTKDEVIQKLNSTLTGGKNNKIILISNPTRNIGFFYNTFNNIEYSKSWKQLHLTVEDSSLIDKNHIEEQKKIWGEHHNIFRVECLGEFPTSEDNSVFTIAEVVDAIERDVVAGEEIEIGVDVASHGTDLSVVALRKGYKCLPLYKFSQLDHIELGNKVIEIVREARKMFNYNKTIRIKIDTTFLGISLYDYLIHDTENNIEPISVNFGDKRTSNPKYVDVVSEMWFNFKDIIRYVSLPQDQFLKEELMAREIKYYENGKIGINGKDEFRKKYKRSPDSADAVMLAFYNVNKLNYVLGGINILTDCVISEKMVDKYINGERMVLINYDNNGTYYVLFVSKDLDNYYILREYCTNKILDLVMEVKKYSISNVISNIIKDNSINKLLYQYGININSFEGSDSFAIEYIKDLFNKRCIFIHKSCTMLMKQLSDWSLVKNKSNVDYGYCNSIILLAYNYNKKENIYNGFNMYSNKSEIVIDNSSKYKIINWAHP